VNMLVCFGPDYRASFLPTNLRRGVTIAASYAAFVAICVALSEATRAHIEYSDSIAAAPLCLPRCDEAAVDVSFACVPVCRVLGHPRRWRSGAGLARDVSS
jgi:hypothetical protein